MSRLIGFVCDLCGLRREALPDSKPMCSHKGRAETHQATFMRPEEAP